MYFVETKDWIEEDEFEDLENLDEEEKSKILDELEDLFNNPNPFDDNFDETNKKLKK